MIILSIVLTILISLTIITFAIKSINSIWTYISGITSLVCLTPMVFELLNKQYLKIKPELIIQTCIIISVFSFAVFMFYLLIWLREDPNEYVIIRKNQFAVFLLILLSISISCLILIVIIKIDYPNLNYREFIEFIERSNDALDSFK